jgi:hypothetical protein
MWQMVCWLITGERWRGGRRESRRCLHGTVTTKGAHWWERRPRCRPRRRPRRRPRCRCSQIYKGHRRCHQRARQRKTEARPQQVLLLYSLARTQPDLALVSGFRFRGAPSRNGWLLACCRRSEWMARPGEWMAATGLVRACEQPRFYSETAPAPSGRAKRARGGQKFCVCVASKLVAQHSASSTQPFTA